MRCLRVLQRGLCSRALPGIVLLVLGWTCAGLPTPSEEAPPQDIDDPLVTCEELEARDDSEYVVLSGHFEEVPEERRVRVVCDDGGAVIVNGNVRVSGGGDGRGSRRGVFSSTGSRARSLAWA